VNPEIRLAEIVAALKDADQSVRTRIMTARLQSISCTSVAVWNRLGILVACGSLS
jgi:hypothetical protein